MESIKNFIDAYAFSEMSGQYYGTYNDMHMVIKKEDAHASVYLYLDLPPAGRKERRELVAEMNARGERLGVKVYDSEDKIGFLKIILSENGDVSNDLERFLMECDLLLRPYGREMGLLCAYCRKEMQDVRPEYKMENGLVVPVCPDCVNLESAGKAKKADNRRTIEKKRMTKGLIGAAIGCAISAVLWTVVGLGGSFLVNIIAALLSVFLIKFLFEKMSRVPNRLTSVTILAFSLFALLIGSAVGYTVNTNQYHESMRETASYMEAYGVSDPEIPYYGDLMEDAKNGVYDDITLIDAYKDPAYYRGIVVSVVAVVIASVGSDSLNLKMRKRR